MSEYNDDLKIDFSELHINWRDQPINYMKWSEKWVNAVSYRDRIKESLEVLKAELDTKYRQELSVDKKPTEAVISSAITNDADYKLQQQQLIDANETVNLLVSAKAAFEHRKKALEGLTQLWVNGYWSDPKIPLDAKTHFESDFEKQKQTLSQNKRLQKLKRKEV